ncbi:NUDIX hydrolase [Agrobacterium vitis]|uniref:DNA mismatch repair protein MutT n=1 Tax=Rhizobium/Agrobacterium group TaxID=227290 RepID=UPI0008DC1689|nr:MULTISPECIES: DNA mismatch repair protein MutT [Rhizobium/Agrobacterium group]MCF1433180.1 NUDIX hydrolase [Allorhizobium ampelinum]MUO91755.1 NUDIX hydrolase [Agrobacterium vitis]MUZ54744.1 NUDIX hydrolase [Agrobacterium vitis]MUZ93016.1 NUDIX hydrolase [Agrobacterium vitis]MVA41462.1 NUDIX hydrolase [Agrobacterium vitis]
MLSHAKAILPQAADDHVSWPADGEIFDVNRLELRVKPGDHPFHTAHRDAIHRNWQAESAANPALFDGAMVLFDELQIGQGAVTGAGHLIPYSTFLFWRRQAEPQSGYHLFGFPVLISSDGALIAVEMAAHTANAGRVYCPAGSLDASDIIDAMVDVDANMRREVQEETGLSVDDAVIDPQLRGYRRGRRVTLFRVFRLALTTQAIFERIAAHMAVDEEQEIARAVAIRSADRNAHDYTPDMYPLLDWIFPG